MPILFNSYQAVITLIAILLMGMPSEQVAANEIPTVEPKESSAEFRVDIVVDGKNNRSPEGALKNKLLVEKLVKMGRAKSQGCTRCHGRLGMQSLARADNWAGSVAEFVVSGLTSFRDGKRNHEVMTSIAARLSDQDIALIATWYQSVSNPSPVK